MADEKVFLLISAFAIFCDILAVCGLLFLFCQKENESTTRSGSYLQFDGVEWSFRDEYKGDYDLILYLSSCNMQAIHSNPINKLLNSNAN